MFGFKNREIRALRAELREATEKATAAERRRGDAHLDDVRKGHVAQCGQLARDVEKWQAGARRVADQNRVLRERLEQAREAQGDADFNRLYERLTRTLRACRRYRGRLADQSALLAAQQRQLDRAMGMDHPDIAAGRDWQSRRPDTGAAKVTAGSPSGVLPRREPGVVDAP